MLTLYYKPTCQYSRSVIRAAAEHGIPLSLVNVSFDQVARRDLFARGGKDQVPYLFDDANNQGLYESEDIIGYLRKNYAASS